MQIEFNRDEVHQLLVMLEVAAQVLGTATADDTGDPAAVRLRDKVFRRAGARAPLDAVAARSEAVLTAYDDEVFWAELIERLAERDVLEAAGGEEAFVALAVCRSVRGRWPGSAAAELGSLPPLSARHAPIPAGLSFACYIFSRFFCIPLN